MTEGTTRYKLTLEYKGTDYAGWQRQPDHPSIQGSLEDAIHGFCQQEVSVTVAGRTDAGVHACAQICHVDLAPLSKPMEAFEIAKAITAHLRPHPISVLHAEIVDQEFNARFDATNKLYRYRIINRYSDLALEKGLAWHIKRALDIEAMQKAAPVLLGHHDFTTFRDGECQAKHPMRTLDRLEIIAEDYDGCGGAEILIEVEAQSFLHHMVRNIVGSLVMVGEGKWGKEDLEAALKARARAKGGPTAPADGLYLVRVDY